MAEGHRRSRREACLAAASTSRCLVWSGNDHRAHPVIQTMLSTEVMVLSEVDARSPHHGLGRAMTPQCKVANCRTTGHAGGQLLMHGRLHPPSRRGQRLRSRGARSRWNDQAATASFVHRKSVPSIQIRCRMTASLRATATFAFFAPDRFISRMPHAFNGDQRSTLVSRTPAAS
jgi:hypothetical protein